MKNTGVSLSLEGPAPSVLEPPSTSFTHKHDTTSISTQDRALTRGFSLRRLADMPEGVKIDWLIDQFLPEGNLCMLFGLPSAGKTALLCGIASAACSGRPWHDHEISRPGAVIWFAGEGATYIRRRIRLWCHAHGIDFTLVEQSLLVVEGGPCLDRDMADVIAGFGEHGIDKAALVIVDTLSRHITGDRNNSADVSRVVAGCKALQAALQHPALILVHHTNWSARKDRSESREAGSITLRGDIDVTMEVRRKGHQEGPLMDGDMVTLSLRKMRDGPSWPDMQFEAKTSLHLPDDPPDATPGFILTLVAKGASLAHALSGLPSGTRGLKGRKRAQCTVDAEAAMLSLLGAGPATQGTLIGVSGVSRTTAQRVLERLVDDGRVRRTGWGYQLVDVEECP